MSKQTYGSRGDKWERFFTLFLIEETKDSYMAYAKRKINPAYLEISIRESILKRMEKIKLTDICNPKQWKTIPTSELLENGYPVYGANGIIGYYSEYNHKNPVITVTCRGATCGTINITVPKSYVTGNAMCFDDMRSDIYMEFLY